MKTLLLLLVACGAPSQVNAKCGDSWLEELHVKDLPPAGSPCSCEQLGCTWTLDDAPARECIHEGSTCTWGAR